MTAQLPTSNALAEASPESISELFSRSPRNFADADIDKIILELRKQRERLMAAEAAGLKPPKPLKQPPTLLPIDSSTLRI